MADNIFHIADKDFETLILASKTPVLVDFWASWCGPCKMLAPVLSQIAEENDDIIVGKVNVDEEMELAHAFKIQSIPTVILFKDGKPVKQSIGFTSKENLEKMWK